MTTSARVRRLLAVLGLVAGPWCLASYPQAGDPAFPGAGSTPTATVVVRVRNSRGTFLETAAKVQLTSRAGRFDRTGFTQETGEATFTGVEVGNYYAEVSAPGFQTEREEVVVHMVGDNVRVFVNLRPEGAAGQPPPPVSPTISVKARREIDAAIESYRRKNLQDARKRLEKVAKSSPLHPDPPYLLGMVSLQGGDTAAAKAHFEKALVLYPAHVAALSALADLLIRERDYAGAIPLLDRAVEAEPTSWRAHGMLAAASYQVKEYQKSRVHAQRALELNQGQSADLRVILAQALLAVGERPACKVQLEEFLRAFPNDPRAPGVRQAIAALETPDPGAGRELPTATVAPGAGEPAAPTRAWAPPDVDFAAPTVTREVPCVLDRVLESAGKRSETLVASMQRMTAAESIEHSLIGSDGEARLTESREFNYMVSIRQHAGGILSVDESRDTRSTKGNFTTGMAAKGLAAMAFVFHPLYAKNYEMVCEGLGEWSRHPAWVIRFRQRPDRHSNFYSYRTPNGSFEVPLRGRAWIATNTGDVLRIELELLQPVIEIQLARNHLEIDYGPVAVNSGDMPLWLPARVALYMEVNKRRYRIRHNFSDVHVFSVESNQKIERIPTPPTYRP